MLPSGASFARSGAPLRAPGSAASRAAAAPGEICWFRLGKYEKTLGTCREHIRKHVENVGLISERNIVFENMAKYRIISKKRSNTRVEVGLFQEADGCIYGGYIYIKPDGETQMNKHKFDAQRTNSLVMSGSLFGNWVLTVAVEPCGT